MDNRNITNTAKYLLYVCNVGLFALVWSQYYNRFAFDTYHLLGSSITILIYIFIYSSLCNVYKAHRIASSSIGETLFSQVISFGIADLIIYAECCLLFNRYVNILPGVITAVVQIGVTAAIITYAKQYFMKYVSAKKTILVHGSKVDNAEVNKFEERLLKKYSHLFDIVTIEEETLNPSAQKTKLDTFDVAILYELSEELRGKYMEICMKNHKQFYFSPRVEDILFQGCTPKHLLDTPLMKYDYKYEDRRELFIKRIFDIAFSLFALIILSPILLLIALCIKLEDGGPVFYKQKRCTKDARVFEILKFRSTRIDAEKYGAAPCTDHDPRITRIGRLIRKIRFDEMPQFINIIKGDMSVVGPRPERVEHVEKYTKEVPEFAYRMRVLGGLTGYAQIFGKYNTSAHDKLRLDLMYVENQSILLDLKLVVLTIRTMFMPESTEGFVVKKKEGLYEMHGNSKIAEHEEHSESMMQEVIHG